MIVIDPGHGGADPGCQANGLVEKQLTLRLAKLSHDLAQAISLPMELTRDVDATLPLSTRGRLAHGLGASQVVNLHFDSNPDPHVGRLTCYCAQADLQSADLAKAIIQAAPPSLTAGSGVIHVEAQGWKRRAYNVVHAFDAPALLIECAFLSNPHHADFLRQPFGLAAISTSVLCALLGTPSLHGGSYEPPGSRTNRSSIVRPQASAGQQIVDA